VYMGEATYSGWQGEAGPARAWLNPTLLPDTMTIRGMSSLATALRIKLTEVLYVSWAWHWFSLLRCQADTSMLAHLGYPVGTFPTGGKFVHALLAKHPLEDQIIHLELPASHKPLVVAPVGSVHF
jgi:hypothetical protein